MDREKAHDTMNFFIEKLLYTSLNVDKVVLFGSCSQGSFSTDSDIDIAVISGDFAGKSLVQRIELIREAEISTIKRCRVPLDIVTLTPEEFASENSLVSSFARQGIVLYAA